MTQEHAPNGSEWTFASLREYLLRVVADLALKQQALADAQDKAIQAALVAQEKAVQAALAAADKAVAKAEENTRQWQISANEWRGAMGDRERTFIPRSEYELSVRTMAERIDRQERMILEGISVKKGSSETWAFVVAGAGMLGGIAVAVFTLLGG